MVCLFECEPYRSSKKMKEHTALGWNLFSQEGIGVWKPWQLWTGENVDDMSCIN